MPAKILWSVVGGFLAGVFIRSLVPLPWPFAALLFVLSLAACALPYLEGPKRRELIIAACALAACGAGMLRVNAAALRGDPALTARIGQTVILEGKVVDEPDVRESGVRLHVRAHDAGVLVLAPPNTEVRYGDIIRAKGTLELPERFDTSLGRQFDYPMYLGKDGIVYTLSFAQAEKIGEGKKNYLKAAAIWTKQLYLRGLQQALPEPQSGLAGGITVGDKRGVGKEYSDIFIAVGLIHIIVLSGYNITIIMNRVGGMLSATSRLLQIGASALIVVFIVLMAGAAPSAVRAGTMALLPLIARMTGRMYLALRALGAVALVMVAWNPLLLAFDPGFQLSVLATLGLVLFSPIFFEWLPWIPQRFALREIAASTLGTQTMVLPLLLYQNGILSLVALPANLLALIVAPWAMAFSAIAALAGIVLGSRGVLIALPAYALLSYILGVAEFFDALPFSSVSISAFSAWWMAGAYTLMFGGWLLIRERKTAGQSPAVVSP